MVRKEHFNSSRFAFAFTAYVSLFTLLVVLIIIGKAETIWSDLIYAMVADVGFYLGAKTVRGYSGKLAVKKEQGE